MCRCVETQTCLKGEVEAIDTAQVENKCKALGVLRRAPKEKSPGLLSHCGGLSRGIVLAEQESA